MRAPRDDVRATHDERADSPDFDSWDTPEDVVTGGRTRDDFLNVVFSLYEPATISEIAERAGRGTDSAREYMDWFEQMGMVRKVSENPSQYQVNRSYLAWRRCEKLQAEYQPDELITLLTQANEEEKRFRDQFNCDDPRHVTITEYADATETPIEEVWERVSEWKTVNRRVALLEQALRSYDDREPDEIIA